MKKLYNQLEIKQKLFTVYYSQTDRQIERVNQEMEQYLWLYMTYTHSNTFDPSNSYFV